MKKFLRPREGSAELSSSHIAVVRGSVVNNNNKEKSLAPNPQAVPRYAHRTG